MTQLRKLAGDCDDVVTCPAVYIDDDVRTDGHIVVTQGPQVVDQDTLAQLNLGPGEVALRLPPAFIIEAARQLAERP